MNGEGNHKNEKSEAPKLFTKKQAAKILGISEFAVRKMVKNGVLKRCENLGDRPWYFTQKHFDDFVNNISGGVG